MDNCMHRRFDEASIRSLQSKSKRITNNERQYRFAVINSSKYSNSFRAADLLRTEINKQHCFSDLQNRFLMSINISTYASKLTPIQIYMAGACITQAFQVLIRGCEALSIGATRRSEASPRGIVSPSPIIIMSIIISTYASNLSRTAHLMLGTLFETKDTWEQYTNQKKYKPQHCLETSFK